MKALVMISTRFDTNANRSVAGPIISAREYLKANEIDVTLDYDMIPFWFSSDSEPSFSNEFLNVRGINDLEIILQMYTNYDMNRELIDGIDFKFYKSVVEIYKRYNKKIPYDYFLVSSYDSFLAYDLLAIFLVKQNNPHIKTVLGGSVTIYYEKFAEFFTKLHQIDYTISGDIENSLELLFNNELPLGYNKTPHVDMSKLVAPVYNEKDIKLSDGYLAIAPYRGCPFNCNFCNTSHLDLKTTPTDNFTSWVKTNMDNQMGHTLHLNSPTINYSDDKFDELLEGLISIDNKYRLQSWFRIEKLTPDVVDKMHKANFDNLYIGLDSFFTRVRKKQNKRGVLTEKHVIDALDRCMHYNMHISMAFVRNFPQVTEFENVIENAFYNKLRDRYPKTNLRIRNYIYILTLGSPVQKNPERFGVQIEYWKNPYKHLPEFDEAVQKIPKTFSFINPETNPDFKWIDEECDDFNEYKPGYVPETELGERWRLCNSIL